jgi:hypothetical protein
MAKHTYDKDGNYTGKVLSDEEHDKKQRHSTPPESHCYFCDKKMFDSSLETIDIKKELGENIFNELPKDQFTLNKFKQKEKICAVCKGKLSAEQIKEIVAKKRRERNVLYFGFIFCMPLSFFITIILNQEGLLTNTSLYNFLFFIILNAILIHFFKKVVGKFYPISQK